jgi:hypothetical protein
MKFYIAIIKIVNSILSKLKHAAILLKPQLEYHQQALLILYHCGFYSLEKIGLCNESLGLVPWVIYDNDGG